MGKTATANLLSFVRKKGTKSFSKTVRLTNFVEKGNQILYQLPRGVFNIFHTVLHRFVWKNLWKKWKTLLKSMFFAVWSVKKGKLLMLKSRYGILVKIL
ncbi:MAG: hypothetical protein UHM85_04815 [Acutalibacteraceae bacterium]|nr:hypothetical protein [Acutalibacteraceae bacterium]